MLNAGRLFTSLRSIGTKVAEAGSHRNEIYIDFIGTGRNQFVYLDTDHAFRKVVLLLAGNLTGMTPGAPIILD
jgi:hypothetical protein